jgi:hypothetical protein
MELFDEIVDSAPFLIAVGLLTVLLLVGVAALLWTRRWAARLRAGSVPTAVDLESYRLLRDQGELTDEEFERISQLMGGTARTHTDQARASNENKS